MKCIQFLLIRLFLSEHRVLSFFFFAFPFLLITTSVFFLSKTVFSLYNDQGLVANISLFGFDHSLFLRQKLEKLCVLRLSASSGTCFKDGVAKLNKVVAKVLILCLSVFFASFLFSFPY